MALAHSGGFLAWLGGGCRRRTEYCVSKRQAEIISDTMPAVKERLKVIYNPLPSDMLANELTKELDDTSTFLYIGGIVT